MVENVLVEIRQRLGSVNVFLSWKAAGDFGSGSTSGIVPNTAKNTSSNFTDSGNQKISSTNSESNEEIISKTLPTHVASTIPSTNCNEKWCPLIEFVDLSNVEIILPQEITSNELRKALNVRMNVGVYFRFIDTKCNNFQWNRNSLSSCSYQLSFRASIKNIQDMRWINFDEISLNKDLNGNKYPSSFEFNKPLITAKETKNVTWYCAHCMNSISSTIPFYERVHSYPHGFIDSENFFCHQHTKKESDTSCAEIEMNNTPEPKLYDLFYGYDYVVINGTQMKDFVYFKDSIICCSHCSSNIGILLKTPNYDTFKIWSDAVRINLQTQPSSSENFEIFSSNHQPKLNRSVCFLLMMVRDIIKLNLPLPIKLLLKDDSTNKLLFLHIFEHHLKVLRGRTVNKSEYEEHLKKNPKNIFESSQEAKLQNVILEPFLALRLLYRIISQVQSLDKHLLSKWQQDFLMMEVSVSPYLMSNLINELQINNELLPNIYRIVQFDGHSWTSSYIFYR